MSTEQSVQFPTYRIQGGPTARSVEIWRNGEKMTRVRAFQIESEANGVVQVTITEYAQLDVIEVETPE